MLRSHQARATECMHAAHDGCPAAAVHVYCLLPCMQFPVRPAVVTVLASAACAWGTGETITAKVVVGFACSLIRPAWTE